MIEEKTAHKPDIRLSQLIAAALAAITAAFLGSRLGVAGTVVGAGVASIVSTVAGALYQHSLDRTTHTVRSRVGQARTDEPAAEGTVLVEPPVARPRRPRWVVAVALTVLAFVIGMGAVTGVELLKNGPISGGDNGTTVGSLFGQPTQRSTPPPTTTVTPTTTAPTTTVPTTTPTTTTAPPTSTTTPAPTATAPPSLTTPP
jgi:hypothetical protein